jgi:dipeptidyl aminopeptidase/acylaminoacyl peptidase
MGFRARKTFSMDIHRKALFLGLLCLQPSVLGVMGQTGTALKETQGGKRPVTVADSIEMTIDGDPWYYRGSSLPDRIAQFSPDGTKFVVVFRRGNLDHNTNDYSLLLWRTTEITPAELGKPPEVVLKMSSSSNREAIRDVTWLSDSERIAFLGEQPGELQQLYTINTRTHVLDKLTNHSTNLLSYSITPDGGKVAYIADEPTRSIFDRSADRYGFHVSNEFLPDLLAGKRGGGTGLGGNPELFALVGSVESRLPLGGGLSTTYPTAFLSPDGRYVLVPDNVAEIPDQWAQYSDSVVQQATSLKHSEGQSFPLRRYIVIDTDKNTSFIPIDAPIKDVASKAIWRPDGRSVFIDRVYLPLDSATGAEREQRRTTPFVVEITLPSLTVSSVRAGDLRLVRWDEDKNNLTVEDLSTIQQHRSVTSISLHKTGKDWDEVPNEADKALPQIALKENMNTPPRLFAVLPTGQEVLLFDPNPQFSELKFAKVEEVEWKGTDGHRVKGGLYYPINYVLGRRYPLVIQTHFWNPTMFWIDGPWTTAFAAQPLAGQDIMVLQADESFEDVGTFKELRREVASFEGAIDYLDRRHLILRNKIGIIGFSRTCLFVKYALTHSHYHFAAASVTDGIDNGYVQYIAANASPEFVSSVENTNGGLPWGEGIKTWLRRVPGFNVNKVSAPLLITAQNPDALLSEWEWYAALKHLHKPVELTYMENGDHLLQKPWERLISQGGSVDWFCFWLKAQEDGDPSKTEQYQRWRKMRVSIESAKPTGIVSQR